MQFRDLQKQYEVLKDEINAALMSVAASANFISGPQVKELERALAEYVGVKHCITCANGTDAITIAMRTWGVGKGDAVFVPDFTFFSSGECPADEGGTPIYVDVDQRTYNIDPMKLEEAVKKIIAEGKYKAKAVVAVDLFGLPADYPEIKAICKKYDLLLLEDGAQGFGGNINGKKACSFGDISTTSFFPAKPLGCYGDGGAIFTDNDEWADLIRSICVHGKDTCNPNDPNAKYNNVRLGKNSRLDTLQAAILLPKFKAFVDYELAEVNKVASWYTEGLKDIDLVLPEVRKGFYSSWAQYTIQLPDRVNRKELQAKLKALGIPSMVYYAKPMHCQSAFAGTDSAIADCPVTEQHCAKVLSLPLDPYKTKRDIDFVVDEIKKAL
ncbi:DegT/DnrJ/EryC1/StrS family aminotransferase [Faecalibaculum rodentium]|jgi:dTDP-4-amino-4,6-dideoxygalactose transaminase|uniref:DegT/DnrJ/EryC1/StrS family aminotransferase n=1 Tax=Faecalibaculum rodentium TaxID=1702221 RepID=UPI0025709256|nr:DegT/DnrJ/EryC1/StrS family aminotransferase [Faecalibaculum rodentium]